MCAEGERESYTTVLFSVADLWRNTFRVTHNLPHLALGLFRSCHINIDCINLLAGQDKLNLLLLLLDLEEQMERKQQCSLDNSLASKGISEIRSAVISNGGYIERLHISVECTPNEVHGWHYYCILWQTMAVTLASKGCTANYD